MPNEKLSEIGRKLIALCRDGKDMEALDTLYAADAISVEAGPGPGGMGPEVAGLDGIRGKHEWWNNAHEIHSVRVEGPFFHGDDRFGAIFEMDVTDKESGARTQMKELAVYTVKDGVIVREEFFYDM